MDELDKGLDIALTGELCDKALAACEKQIAAWGMTMPAVDALVLDFGLGEFAKTGLIEYWIANEVAAGYCGKWLFVFDGQTCPMHHHKDKVETFHLVKGKMTVNYEGEVREFSEGDVLLVETDKPHSFTGVGPALLLEISRPCVIEDNYFANRNIPIGGNSDTKA